MFTEFLLTASEGGGTRTPAALIEHTDKANLLGPASDHEALPHQSSSEAPLQTGLLLHAGIHSGVAESSRLASWHGGCIGGGRSSWLRCGWADGHVPGRQDGRAGSRCWRCPCRYAQNFLLLCNLDTSPEAACPPSETSSLPADDSGGPSSP